MSELSVREILIVINGTVGVGKTSVSEALAQRVPNAIAIEADRLGFAGPDFSNDAFENDYGLKMAIMTLAKAREGGARVFIFDRFFENSKKLEWFLSQVRLESYVFYLTAADEEVASRIHRRKRQRAESEILDSRRIRQNQLEMKNRGIEIDTSGKSIEVVTREIQIRVFGDPSLDS